MNWPQPRSGRFSGYAQTVESPTRRMRNGWQSSVSAAMVGHAVSATAISALRICAFIVHSVQFCRVTRLTLGRYAHAALHDLSAAVDALTDDDNREALSVTGTD